MINTRDKKVNEIIRRIHQSALQKSKKGRRSRKEIVREIITENRMISVFCNDYGMNPEKCARILNATYGEEQTAEGIINILRNRKMAVVSERKAMFTWAEEITDCLEKAINGSKNAFERYKQLMDKIPGKPVTKKDRESGLYQNCPERIAVIMTFRKYPEIDKSENDIPLVFYMGNTLSRYLFYDIGDIISDVYNFPPYTDLETRTKAEKEKKSGEKKEKLTYEQALQRINKLENILERTNVMLEELQDEFDEQLEISKVNELADFFAKLNSEKYGCILDELVMVRKGVDELRKSNYELPVEINGLLIMVKKLIQFIMDCHINPIMRLNAIKEVCATDVEFCSYEGTPFKSPEEKKKVKVISPGWIYKDKELQISRPKLREEN